MLFSTLRQRLTTTLLTSLFLGLTACGGAGDGGGNLVGVTPPTSSAATIDGKQNNSTAETSSQEIKQSSSSSASIISSTAATSSSVKPIASSAKSSISPSSTTTTTNSSASSIIIFTPAASATYSSIAPPPSRPGTTTSQANASAPSTTSAITLLLYRIQTNSITLTWDNSVSAQGVSTYEIYRDNKRIDVLESASRFFTDVKLNSYTEYEYILYSMDSNGNRLAQSEPFRIRTLQVPGTSLASQSSINSSAQSSASTSNKSAASTSNKSASSTSSKSTSSTSSKSTSSSAATQSVTLAWSHPQFRENGSYLELSEIGGYELRYKKDNASNSIYLVINGNKTLDYTLELTTESTVEIAVFDTNGLYSDFIKLYPVP